MSYKKDPVPGSGDQKVSWKTIATFKTYEEANQYLLPLNQPHEKIRRRKNGFDVQVGTPLKKG